MSQPAPKPLLRGHSHQAAFFTALGACAMLIAKSVDKGASLLPICIYSITLLSLFGISALYHRPQWSPPIRIWMRRLDHAAIFLLIAGTSTPICLLGIGGHAGSKLLQLIWVAAFLGILQSLFFVNIPKWISAVLYISVGWIALPFLTEIRASLSFEKEMLILAGGIIYTLGAIVYALKRPNPAPRVFGYHEIFHLFVIIGAALHFIAVSQLLN